jgi:gamma-glutamyl:cysteine ligase YbdK (ATP-grasp superfamily)
MITLGLEEEVFVLEPLLPTTRSLYYLSRLFWQNPKRNYFLTASNFARGQDLKCGMMSGVEVATDICHSTEETVNQLRRLRNQLASVAEGYIAALGHLLQTDTPTNVCALQIHLGGMEDPSRSYDNIAHFLPVLILLLANSPMRKGERFGQSYRLQVGYATGPLTGDRRHRFQDLIISKRLGTIEVRAFDANPNLERIRIALNVLLVLANTSVHYKLDLDAYRRQREQAITIGLNRELSQLAEELNEQVAIPLELLQHTESDQTAQIYQAEGLAGTYRGLDHRYREMEYTPPPHSWLTRRLLQPALGFLTYYFPKFPYISYKYFKEK